MLKLESIPSTGKPTVPFVSWYCPTGLTPGGRRDFREGFSEIFKKNLFLAGNRVQPQGTNTEEGMEKQQTLKALSHASFPFSETLAVYSDCCLWGRNHRSEDRGMSFTSLRKWLLPALLHVGMGTLGGNPKGCSVPEGCAIGKIQHLAQLEKCSRHALNHVRWWERHFYPG